MESTGLDLTPAGRSTAKTPSGISDGWLVKYQALIAQLVLTVLLLWKLPRIEGASAPLSNMLRVPFLGLLGMVLFVMMRSSVPRAMALFAGLALFQPAIQAEMWIPHKFIILFLIGGSLVLYLKQVGPKIVPETAFSVIAGSALLLNAAIRPGNNTPIATWGAYLVAGGFLCGAAKSLAALTREQVRALLHSIGSAVVLMTLLSIVSAKVNDKLPLSYNEFVSSFFRLGQVDMESYNTFGCLCGMGVLTWMAYVYMGGHKLVGVLCTLICLVAMLLSKTLSVLAVVAALMPILMWQLTKGSKLLRGLGFLGLVVFALGLAFLLSAEHDLLSLQTRDKETGSGRLIIWEWAMQLIGSKPLGVGWSDYAAGAPIEQKYVNLQGEEYEPVISPHNSILTSFLFGGVIGGLCYTGLVLSWIWAMVKSVRHSTDALVLVCIGLFSILCHFTMDFWFYNYFIGLLWVYLRPDKSGKA